MVCVPREKNGGDGDWRREKRKSGKKGEEEGEFPKGFGLG